jgi:integrase
VRVIDWLNACLDRPMATKTYDEKRRCFRLFTGHLAAMGQRGRLPGIEGLTIGDMLPLADGEVMLDVLVEYLDLQAATRSGNAANKDRKNLRGAWEYGRRRFRGRGWPRLAVNPFDEIDRYAETRHPRYVPSLDDYWAVYRACRDGRPDIVAAQDQVMLLAFLHLAARRGEIFPSDGRPGLRVRDLDLERGQATLWTRKREGGDMEADLLPLTSELRDALAWWLRVRPVRHENVFVCLDVGHEQGLASEAYGKPFAYRLHFLRRICARIGVRPFSWHAIRHLSARTLHEQGYPVPFIQRVLRHQSESTTRAYLGRIGVESIRQAVQEGMPRPSCKIIPITSHAKSMAPRTGIPGAIDIHGLYPWTEAEAR